MPTFSLNYVWSKLQANGDGRVEFDEVTTPITITFADGSSATATLSLTPFSEGAEGMVDLDLDMDKLHELDDPEEEAEEEAQASVSEDYGREGFTLVDVMPRWAEGWVKQAIVDAFGIDPDSPIWNYLEWEQ